MTRNFINERRSRHRLGDEGCCLAAAPQIPTNGVLLAVRLCLNPQYESTINAIYITQFRQSGFLGDSVRQLADTAPAQAAGCTRYALPEPFVMEPDDFVSVRFQAGWTATGALVRAASTTIEYDRVQ